MAIEVEAPVGSLAHAGGMTSLSRLRRFTDPLIVAVLFVLAWQAAIWIFSFHSVVLPPPSRVWDILVTQGDFLLASMLDSLRSIFWGFFYGSVFGWIAGVFITYSPTVRKAIHPVLVALFVVPKAIFLPLLIIWWGVHGFPDHKIVITAMLAFFPVTENTIAGLSGVDQEMVELNRSLGGSRFLLFRKIALPFSLPFVVAGLRIGMTEAFLGTLFVEILVPTVGIGSRIVDAKDVSNTQFVIAAIVVIAVFGLTAYYLVQQAERRLTKWY
jgi:NitT/TauT family transport system permease protein